MNFTTDQKIKTLEAAGYTVKYEDYICYATDYWQQDSTRKVYQVYDASGNKIDFNFENVDSQRQLDLIFSDVMAENITELILKFKK